MASGEWRRIAVSALLLTLAAGARAQSGGGYDLSWSTVASGGGDSSAAGFFLSGTIGQADAGALHGGDYDLLGGFWAIVATAAPLMCVGDCGHEGQVTVDELLAMVNIALGNAMLATCRAGDSNSDGEITVDEIIVAVNNALNGCPSG